MQQQQSQNKMFGRIEENLESCHNRNNNNNNNHKSKAVID